MPFRLPIRVLLALSTLLACAFSTFSARPQSERILDFHSEIALQPDASLLVTEIITVNSTGAQMRHGIYRDFPTRYSDSLGNKYVVGFEMLAALRDNADEHFRVEDYANGKRVYLGTADTLLPPGQHSYTLTYRTNRQLGFFADHDELFWNVTGLGWGFPVDHASATVQLLSSIPVDQVHLSGYTGPEHSLKSELTTASSDGSYIFTATRGFRPHEGLTILLSWPKGYVAPLTFSQKLDYFFRDNRDALLLAIGLLAILLYYFFAWSAVGRDPAAGVIMPLYEPPPGLSPGAMRYLVEMGYDNKTFAAAILDMAVRGYLRITQEFKTYTLTLTGKSTNILTPDEQLIATELFDGRTQILLKQENHTVIHAAQQTFSKWLKDSEQRVYFVTNSRYLIPPVALTLAVAALYFLRQPGDKIAASLFLGFWLTFWTFGVSVLFLRVYACWRDLILGRNSTGIATAQALFLTIFAIPFLFGEVFGVTMLARTASISIVVFLLAAAIIHGIFVHLMKAPTFAGRRLLDQVQGFKLFLSSVDGDRLNRILPPEQSPAVFEKFLPYALALSVEQAWAEKFSAVLSAAGTSPGSTGSAYTPSFYSASSMNGFSGSNFASSFSSSFTTAIASSSSAPGSGGGGGSGGSGGGGGGGGGGGW
ncbi:MAG TPA: DUF2207 domain-containing protein [Candidatus Sulfotelmatobacter sp.]|nr:DUF2207 domain-containing protein [Candidatus Sulfotelmatobacter sp.]